ncbi:hypothetical protein ACIRN4_17455 [Pimelobacter simplex]|uniref:Uncharacterized protein n=1 Tax=Nocardioides simplex TaxID=2045 RepID=A0A7J5E0F5_NOCSI|nr:hypothetical protein [Pimelobacter simplex]KAB2811394.1 hypothetical protein F9L07_05720 [Pimelobacter simplex]
MSQQPPPPPPPPPPGYLRLTVQGNFMLSMITPSIQLDGYPVAAKYGQNVYPVVPGVHQVAGYAQWMWRYGHAQQQFQVAPGQTVDVFYAAPALTFIGGRIGFEKQRTPGLLAMLLVLGGILALLVGLVVLVAVSA